MKRNIVKIVVYLAIVLALGLGLVFAYEIQISLPIGSKTAMVNDKPMKLDVPAQIINGRTMVPLRFITESLGCEVQWDELNRVVLIWQKREDSIAETLNKMETSIPNEKIDETRRHEWNFSVSKKYFRVEVKYMAKSKEAGFFLAITGPNGERGRFVPELKALKDKECHVGIKEIETMGNNKFGVIFDSVKGMSMLDVKIFESDLPASPTPPSP